MVISRGNGAVDLEVTDHPLDPISLAIELLAVADRNFAVRLRWDDRFDASLLEVIADCIGVVGLVGEQGVGRLLGQIDQRVVALAVRRFAWCEFEGDGPTSGITETMNLIPIR